MRGHAWPSEDDTQVHPRGDVIALHDVEAYWSVRFHDAEFSGPEAAELAGVTYRQVDYWARQRWVVPSGAAPSGAHRRAYTATDVVRLGALGHLRRAHVDVATYGRRTGQLRLPTRYRFLVVWNLSDATVRVARTKDLRPVVCEPGRFVVYDPTTLLRAVQHRVVDRTGKRARRRTFTDEFKLAMLSEYDGLTEPGAKGAMLQREGLYSSHLVSFRQQLAQGSLTPAAKGPEIDENRNLRSGITRLVVGRAPVDP